MTTSKIIYRLWDTLINDVHNLFGISDPLSMSAFGIDYTRFIEYEI